MSGCKREGKTSWRQTWPIWLTFGILFGIGGFGVWVLNPNSQRPTKVLAQGEDVRLGSQDLQKGEPRLFAIPLASGENVEFFVERGADDDIIVAFASCRKCYRSGHYRQDSQIFCGRCNEPMERVGAGKMPASASDCTQVRIPFERSGEDVLIRADAVRETFARWYVPGKAADERK